MDPFASWVVLRSGRYVPWVALSQGRVLHWAFRYGSFVFGSVFDGAFCMYICCLRQVSPFSAQFLSGCWSRIPLAFCRFLGPRFFVNRCPPLPSLQGKLQSQALQRENPAFQRECRNLRSAFPGLFDLLRRLFVPRLTYHVAVFWRKWLCHFSKNLSHELKNSWSSVIINILSCSTCLSAAGLNSTTFVLRCTFCIGICLIIYLPK